MSQPITIMGGDYPKCVEPGCSKLAEDGFCLASCCADRLPAVRVYCNEHSHRPQLVLDALGFHAERQAYQRDDVLRILRACWMGAGLVIENAGHFQLVRQLEKNRAAAAIANAPENLSKEPGIIHRKREEPSS